MITLYSTHCPKCNVLETKLKDKNIEYTEVNDISVMRSKGILSVPVLEVNDKYMLFSDAVHWINDQPTAPRI